MARPLAPSFAGFDRRWIRSDVVAGLTVWAVLVPESLAYATIAGVPPVVGLYAAVPALALYALLGSSRHLVVSPMSATAALSLSVVAAVATDPTDPAQVLALTTALALATGLVALAAGGLRLGFLAAFISEPVLKGFIIGLALTIMVGQLPALFGVEKGSGNFFEKAWDLIQDLGDAELLATTVGIGSLLLLLACAGGCRSCRARWSWHSAASPWSRCWTSRTTAWPSSGTSTRACRRSDFPTCRATHSSTCSAPRWP